VRLILASGSPRRRELLEGAGLAFEVIPSDVPEVREEGETPQLYVQRLALAKAAEVAGREREAWVIGADTVVWIDGTVLEKPLDRADAAAMLGRICGWEHVVYTGLALVNNNRASSSVTVTASQVRMLELGKADIEWYVGTGEPLDKAGSYAVQGVGGWFIESIQGSYTNVVGLPLHALFMMMRSAGLDPLRDFRT
jgi:septum formation protein